MVTEWQQTDPTGALIVAARDYAAAVAIAEPTSRRGLAAIALGTSIYGDEKERDQVAPYVILRRLGPARRAPRAPFTRFRYAALCYGSDYAQATSIYGLMSDAFAARKGPRRVSPGVAIYITAEELGGQAGQDPDTDEPFETAIFLVSVPNAQA